MTSVLDGVQSESDPLLFQLQRLAEVITQQNATIAALRAERDNVYSKHQAAQAEIEKLRLLIRQLQRGQFGRRSERLDWLTDVLERMVSGRIKSHELTQLLSWTWKAEQLAAVIHA